MQHEDPYTTPQPETAPRLAQVDPAARRRDLPYKIPFLAGFLSGFFPGVGQLYVGYYRQGITLAVLVAGIITILASGGARGLEPFLGITLGYCWLYGIIDATRRAQAVNRALDGFGQERLPEDFALPGGGSVFGGSVLIVLGVVLLLHTRFDMSLDWVADWWPLFLIAVGGWLIRQSRREAAARAAGGEATNQFR